MHDLYSASVSNQYSMRFLSLAIKNEFNKRGFLVHSLLNYVWFLVFILLGNGHRVVFSALHEMPARTRDKKGVCPSVCPSAWQTRGLWQNGRRSVNIFMPYERSFSLVFREEWLVQATASIWNFGSSWPRWSKIAHSTSAVAPSKKVQLKLIGSPLCFPMSLRWTSYVAPKPPKERLKNAKRVFSM